jgi:hypothetical protein
VIQLTAAERTDSRILPPEKDHFCMEDILKGLIGHSVEISCGSSAVYRGEVVEVGNGVVHLRIDDAGVTYVALQKIVSVVEEKENSSRPGFIS